MAKNWKQLIKKDPPNNDGQGGKSAPDSEKSALNALLLDVQQGDFSKLAEQDPTLNELFKERKQLEESMQKLVGQQAAKEETQNAKYPDSILSFAERKRADKKWGENKKTALEKLQEKKETEKKAQKERETLRETQKKKYITADTKKNEIKKEWQDKHKTIKGQVSERKPSENQAKAQKTRDEALEKIQKKRDEAQKKRDDIQKNRDEIQKKRDEKRDELIAKRKAEKENAEKEFIKNVQDGLKKQGILKENAENSKKINDFSKKINQKKEKVSDFLEKKKKKVDDFLEKSKKGRKIAGNILRGAKALRDTYDNLDKQLKNARAKMKEQDEDYDESDDPFNDLIGSKKLKKGIETAGKIRSAAAKLENNKLSQNWEKLKEKKKEVLSVKKKYEEKAQKALTTDVFKRLNDHKELLNQAAVIKKIFESTLRKKEEKKEQEKKEENQPKKENQEKQGKKESSEPQKKSKEEAEPTPKIPSEEEKRAAKKEAQVEKRKEERLQNTREQRQEERRKERRAEQKKDKFS